MRSRRRDYDGSCTLRPGKENKRNQIPPLGFIAKKASTIWDSIYERASAGFSAGASLEQLNS